VGWRAGRNQTTAARHLAGPPSFTAVGSGYRLLMPVEGAGLTRAKGRLWRGNEWIWIVLGAGEIGVAVAAGAPLGAILGAPMVLRGLYMLYGAPTQRPDPSKSAIQRWRERR